MQKGFTLIELVVVIAIVAILAALAIPSYQTFIAKSQASEAMMLVGGLKAAVSESYSSDNTCPVSGSGPIPAATGVSGKYVASVTALGTSEGCTLRATFRETGVAKPLQGRIITFTLVNHSGSYHWACTANLDQRYLPTSCSATAE